MLDRLLGQPAAGLLLRPPQKRDHRGGLSAFRVFRDLRLGPGEIVRREGELLRLQVRFGEAADGHHSPFRARRRRPEHVDNGHSQPRWRQIDLTVTPDTGIEGFSVVAPVVDHDALLGQHDEIMSYAPDREILDQLCVRVVALARGRSDLDNDQGSIERH